MQHSRTPRLVTRYVAACAVVALAAACGDATAPVHTDSAGGEVESPASGSRFVNPILGRSFFVPKFSFARRQADEWRSSRPADAALMDKIAAQPQAQWFGNWNADVRSDVDRVVSAAASTGALPVLVAYNIPLRDCGSFSAGGASTADAYRAWIGAYAAGLAGRKALVVLEPDALGGMGCLSAQQQDVRVGLLRHAVEVLRSAGALVYLDAGNHRWQTPATIASRLKRAGIELATGFSLNVSNFFNTSDEAAYGSAVSALVGGKHYVIDTSRNGLGPTLDAQWCNPEGRALGPRPTSFTGRALVDAYLWIKVPGESDGSCNGYPRSGTWVPEYALGLAQRASW